MKDPTESAAARTARERLEHTRRELLRSMNRERGDAPREGPADTPYDDAQEGPWPDTDAAGQARASRSGDDGLGATWQNLRQTAGAWWRSHPAHLALEVAEPVFEKYARAHPVRVLALSAAAGAALVLARPWRLISVTGLLVAAVRSTQMSALASAMLRPQSAEPMRRHEAERARAQERQAWRQAQADARAQDRAR